MSWNDVTPGEVYNKWEHSRLVKDNPIARLNIKERAHVRAEVEGVSVTKYGFKKDSKVFDRPRVIDAIDAILDQCGLSDKKLSKRLGQIIFYGKGANADNTAHNAIRTVFQLRGKFAPDKHEVLHKSDLQNLSDEQLDMIISAGLKEVRITNIKTNQTDAAT